MHISGEFLSSACDVFFLFLIPIGGGIPPGVILAKSRGLEWPVVTLLYLLSDIVLACIFEALMLWFIKAAKNSNFLSRWAEAYKMSLNKMGMGTVLSPGPFALIMLSFGVDPMTGRVATKAAGHGFIVGWSLAICGDMLFFALIMASTLLLNNILGNGTLAAIIIMIAMIGLPILTRRLRSKKT